MKNIDPVLLGHNQFFGISHLSSERALEREIKFSNVDNVIEIIKYAHSIGINGMMMSTHPRAALIASKIKKDPSLKNLNIYLLLPYMAKYVRSSNEKGLVKMVLDIVKDGSPNKIIEVGVNAGLGLLRKDHFKMLETLIDVELMPFKGLNIHSIFLHNSLTDLACGLGLESIFAFYNKIITEKYRANPALCTLSFHALTKFLEMKNIECPLIMAPFNPQGYQMSPSREACEKALETCSSQVIAMSILAGGASSPKASLSYLENLKNINSVIIGASSQENIKSSFNEFSKIF